MTAERLLEARGLLKAFGGLLAVNRVDFTIHTGEILALIGPNGAGKTTIFNLISGTHSLDSGEITFEGRPIVGLRPSQIAVLGVVRTFQNLQIFDNMTALENVMVGCHLHGRTGFLPAALRLPWTGTEEVRLRSVAMEFLGVVGLEKRANVPAADLPFGQQRLVEIARALAVRPKLLLLDEPAAGLTRVEAELLNGLINHIKEEGITVCLVEHDMNLVMGIADRIIVLQYGMLIADGSPEEVQSDATVIDAYLGVDWLADRHNQRLPSTIEADNQADDA